MESDYDVVILGAGAAGLAAGLYTTRAMLRTIILEQLGPGGQLLVTDEIDNYPGFPEGIKGQELAMRMEQQTTRFGAEIEYTEVVDVENISGPVKTVKTDDRDFTTKAIIIATGGSHNKLGVSGEDALAGRGVSYCAVCDGNFFRGQDVVVVGGGDAAMDEGHYLSGIVNSVTFIHRRDELRAAKVLQERAFNNDKIKFLWSTVVEEFRGDQALDRALVKDLKTEKTYEYPMAAAFIYVGFHPNTEYLSDLLVLDSGGHVCTDIHMRTAVPKVYACGDARAESTRQLGAAVGDGITAALACFHDLST
ncbi:MAG: thioredoxin-disulfide reductase [SAR202 cluster bacterium]|jgi:thioredoxin reductase (NADPH)|nr:thioredoxin-disulfide reductase [Chloroflexota bacterium]MDP6497427.1 thioredoxin-disulfide reductase [Dehalococcoidia bacterium]MQF88277.1 thioredoxin-disulfide reductase [SAR202 cluster bacterium]MDP7587378.1 thioredoxin-disulfide reductase [Dehalococcoidia bacterium]MQG10268.1 thioredoxin-disulfide reductase [SAR202 cluster bacterium]|tara:strand:+ start:2317 stop:3237 length:921 start_codon:yes stop_codon:yes gene_type:complete